MRDMAVLGEGPEVPDAQRPIVGAAGHHVGYESIPADDIDVAVMGLQGD